MTYMLFFPADDLDYSESNVALSQAQGVRKNISLKLKGKGRGRGRRGSKVRRGSTKKSAADDDVEEPTEQVDALATEKKCKFFDLMKELLPKIN